MANPWYPFYSGDYGRDTADLSLVEHGAYRLLLDYYYAGQAPLPIDKVALYRICRAFDEGERLAVDSVVQRFFVLECGNYHNSRADRELANQVERTTRLSSSGRRGAQKRWGTTGHYDGHPNGEAYGQANGVSMANPQPQPQPQKEKDAPPSKPDGDAAEFHAFWDAYPKKVGKHEANRSWIKMRCEGHLTEILSSLSAWMRTGQWAESKFIPYPATWLNKGRFREKPSSDAFVQFGTREETERAQRHVDASAGRYDPHYKPREQTPEEEAEIERTRIEGEWWDGLNNGTLAVGTETVMWAKVKLERLRKVPNLPAQDRRPAQLSSFLKRAGEACPEAI